MRIFMNLSGAILVWMAFCFPVLARAGVISGGGGKVVICKAPGGSITSVELLDLWEARVLYNQKIQEIANLEDGVASALDRLRGSYESAMSGSVNGPVYYNDDYTFHQLRSVADRFLKEDAMVMRLHGVTLEYTNDGVELLRPDGCEFGQVVSYEPSGRVFVDQDLFERMDTTNQAALIAHEALYAFLRVAANERNSVRTRRAVGVAFAGFKFAYQQPSWSNHGLYCESGEMGVYSITESKTIIEFEPIAVTAMSPTAVMLHLSLIDWSALMGVSQTSWTIPLSSNSRALTTGKCIKNDGTAFEWPLSFDGPVEFDRQAGLQWRCLGGRFTLNFGMLAPGTGQVITQKMTCKLR